MDHTRIFDHTNPNWVTNNADYNLLFLRSVENYLNNMLRLRGIVFVNEVYQALDFERTQEGQTHGWWLDVNDPNYPSLVRFRLEHGPDMPDIRVSFFDNGEVHQHLTSEKVPA